MIFLLLILEAAVRKGRKLAKCKFWCQKKSIKMHPSLGWSTLILISVQRHHTVDWGRAENYYVFKLVLQCPRALKRRLRYKRSDLWRSTCLKYSNNENPFTRLETFGKRLKWKCWQIKLQQSWMDLPGHKGCQKSAKHYYSQWCKEKTFSIQLKETHSFVEWKSFSFSCA